MGVVHPQTPHRSPRQAFGGNLGEACVWVKNEAGGTWKGSCKPACVMYQITIKSVLKRLHPIKGFVYHSGSWDPFADEVPLLGACLVDHAPTNFAPILGCVSFRHIMVK